ncbi:glycosyltransferase [Croceibacterium mercuriale]|uniref:glycosyltransferase n=1 Tax=Croceibacterium mercuriale TaxID=1572751 RepID=UPI000691EB18|nr:glycosyltransferase [Croceibacterium mercuriale]
MSISVVIPAYNAAPWLVDAIASVAAQDVPAEVIVVDDGSTDDTVAVAERAGVRVLRHPAARGPSAARNSGARAATGDAVLFLDADDRLLPGALAAAAACRTAHPAAAFVYGAHRRVDAAWRPLTPAVLVRCEPDARLAFLRTNCVGMIASALFDRAKLLEAGGFDEALRQCEDYDLFLRLALRWPVACHVRLMAEYRIHGTNASGDPARVLAAAWAVQARHEPADPAGRAAVARGRREWAVAYALAAWRDIAGLSPARIAGQRWRMARLAPAASLIAAATWAARRILPQAAFARVKRRLTGTPQPGRANLGDLDRPTPISPNFGYDRGTPIDRFYIERFLDRHRADITGRVLEVGDAAYSQQFGGAAITRQDVLHAHAENPEATIVGDLGQPGLLPADAFDCMVLTQTLMLVWDMPAAAAELYRALKPGGVLLLTVPGTSSVDRGEWGANWFWSLTGSSVTRMFEGLFGAENMTLRVEGNVYAATCFLHGLAQEEVRTDWLEQADTAYPMVVTLRAVKAG